jgi:nucleoside-diphosphate-sugar epimerase
MNDNTAASTRRLHVVVGAGPIGSGIARILTAQGHPVRVITRSGSGPAGQGVEMVAADASDAPGMVRLTEGAAAVYNCANPPYHRWPELWPPLAASLLSAAERCDGVLVTIANLYGYGPARLSQGTAGYDEIHPMTEATPQAATGSKGRVRAQMWRDAFAAHVAGRVRATEVRASDYVGPGAQSVLGERVVPKVLRGKGVSVLGRTDRLHTWTYTRDVARLAVVAATDPRAWGRAWHAPSGPPRTQRDAVDRRAGPRPCSCATGCGTTDCRAVLAADARAHRDQLPVQRGLRDGFPSRPADVRASADVLGSGARGCAAQLRVAERDRWLAYREKVKRAGA